MPVVTTGAPTMPVDATPRRPLIADASDAMFESYWVGMALKNAGGVDAANAELTMDWMSPVTPAAAAALWIATPRGTITLLGM